MDKIKVPKTMSELLETNITKVKKNETYIAPKTDTDYDKQQSERFSASSANFSDWNKEFRKQIFDLLGQEIFDKWTDKFGEQLMLDWKKGVEPLECAKTIAKLFLTKGMTKRSKK